MMADTAAPRRRKSARSRLGCANCKRSHLRCDESSPCCGRCARLRVECKYTTRALNNSSHDRAASLRTILPVPKQCSWSKQDTINGRRNFEPSPPPIEHPRKDDCDGQTTYTGISDGFVQYMNMPRLGEEERDSPCALPELVESDAAAMGRTSDYYTATEALDWHLSMEEDTWYLPVNLSPGYSSLSLSSTFSESVATRHPPEQSICLDNEKMPSCSFAAFKSIRQPSAAMLMGGFKKWRHLQTYLLHLSSKQGVVQDALLCLENILSHELGMQSSTSSDKDMTSDARFQHAKDHLIQVCSGNEDEMSSKCLEHLLAALYLLAWVEVIRLKQPERTEETTFPSEQADMIIVQGDGKWNRYSRQLLSCFNSLDAKACHLGGSPILSEKALAVVSRYPIQITDCGYDDEANDGAAESKETLVSSSSSDEPETFQQGYYHPKEAATAASQLAKGIIDTKQVVLRAVLQPVAEWYLRTQVYFRHITCLDKHRRPRFTPEDELQVSLRGRQIQSELEDLWEERPTIVSLTAADLAQTMAPDVASRMHEVFGVYLASYWILFVYLHRVCWWHLPHTTTVTNALSQTWKNLQSSYSSSEEETEEEQQQEEGRRSGSHLKKKKKRTVHPALMWPVFIYGSETMCDSEQKWAVEQIKRLALPRPIVMESDGYKCSDRLPPLRLSQGVTQNALRAGMLLEALIIQQRSSGARVDIRDLAVDMFGCFFSIV